MKKFIAIAIGLLTLFSIECVAKKPAQLHANINLALTSMPKANKYANLAYGIRLNVRDDRTDKRLIHVYDGGSTTSLPDAQANPPVMAFVPESMRRYMRTMGFNLDADIATDYLLQMYVSEFHVDYLSGVGWGGTVIMRMEVKDHTQTLVYPTVEIEGRASAYGNPRDFSIANEAINQAYANALADIDWDRIAFFLHRSKEGKTNQKAKLEKAPIHWEIQSRPQGADIYWRVISSTEEVKNQNTRYLETTPYETTEPFDIKGLTYENSVDVQIEIRCEKEGYATQKKRFSLNSILDEKELSVFFKLVKQEE